MSHFEELLKGLSTTLGTPLHVDHLGHCQIIAGHKLHLQLTLDRLEENLVVGAFLGEIIPGKFRENLLKETLKANHLFPLDGTLSYCDKNNQLALTAFLPLSSISSEILTGFLKSFIIKAEEWRKKIETT